MKSETKVTSLGDMANYEDQSVVSKTLIEKKSGIVTLFAFDQGQGLSEHTAPFDALVYVMEGEAEITVSGKPYSLERGKMIIIPAGEPHALRAVKRFKMMLTMIKS
jgi:quercetin dioxygenase-like cupin family protein